MQFISDLRHLSQDDSQRAGGKGANLAALLSADLPVPPAFVLLTDAYQEFIAANDLHEPLNQALFAAHWNDPAGLEGSASHIEGLFLNGRMPAALAGQVSAAYAALGRPAVAVRSSATAEDLPSASFAGQYASLLNVATLDELLPAIRLCWASLWSARALQYRQRHQIAHASVRMAVIVQRMIPAVASGVLFTANPISGSRDEMLINAAAGLGEALVSGQVTPDTLVIDAATHQIKQMTSGDPDPAGRGPLLDPAEIAALAGYGAQVERLFGMPQDIEWVLAGGALHLVQSRPITSRAGPASAAPPQAPGDDSWNRAADLAPLPFDLWTRTNIGENLPFPVTPATETLLLDMFQPAARPQARPTQGMRRFYGRLYFNEGAMLHNLAEEWGIPRRMLDKSWGSRSWAPESERGRMRPLRLLRRLGGLARSRLAARLKGRPLTAAEFFAQVERWTAEFGRQDLSALDAPAVWEQIALWRERGRAAFADNLRFNVSAAIGYAMLERLVRKWAADPGLLVDLIAAPDQVYSAEVGPALWRMAASLTEAGLAPWLLETPPQQALARLESDPAAAAFRRQLADFLARHGHRCPNELEFYNPRWGEEPAQVIDLVSNYLRAEAQRDPVAAAEQQRRRADQARATILARLGPGRRPIMRSALQRAQRAIATRDNSRYAMARIIYPLRQLYARLGQLWAAQGWIERAGDIFFFTVAEIGQRITPAPDRPADLRPLVAARRQAYEYWFAISPPDALSADGTPIIAAPADATCLQGLPASAGRVRGRARIVHNVQDALRLGAGDILITRATDPGWTPIFPLVSAIVLEVGGQLSHGAIVAREYGTPAVINVVGATRIIREGQLIVVDGSTGEVLLEADPADQAGRSAASGLVVAA
jgi:rifampicin phosphotransferase